MARSADVTLTNEPWRFRETRAIVAIVGREVTALPESAFRRLEATQRVGAQT
jgi:hypothetical protein